MASTTPNIGLTLPTGTEGWKRSVINGNFSILDTKIGAVGNKSLQTQVTELSSKLEPSGYSSATRSGTFLSSGSCYYVQIGKIVLVHVTDMTVSSAVPSSSATYANAYFTGLPKAKTTGRLFMLNQFSTSKAMRVSVVNGTNDAAIASHYDGVSASGNQFYGTFWYIAD